MAYVLIAHTVTYLSASPSIDTSGADLLVAFQAEVSDGGFPNPTDSKGNTWTRLTTRGGGTEVAIFYVASPIVGSGHTFTPGSDGGFNTESLAVQAWSGSVASPFDQQNGKDDASPFPGFTVQIGSVTPSQDNELIVSCIGWRRVLAGPVSISAGFTISDQNAFSRCVAMAYQVQTTASAQDPTWTFSLNDTEQTSGAVATFKSSGGATQTYVPTRMMLGMGM